MNVFQKVTLKTLKENKTRTLVTIIGILLSLSMFTAVTVSLSSFRNYYLNITIQREGNWHGAVPATEAELADLASDPAIDCVSFLTTMGYAPLLDSENPDKPYLFIGGLDENAGEMLPLTVIEGRLPQNQSELLIPEHLAYNGGLMGKVVKDPRRRDHWAITNGDSTVPMSFVSSVSRYDAPVIGER